DQQRKRIEMFELAFRLRIGFTKAIEDFADFLGGPGFRRLELPSLELRFLKLRSIGLLRRRFPGWLRGLDLCLYDRLPPRSNGSLPDALGTDDFRHGRDI